jgi:hypothetical protein
VTEYQVAACNNCVVRGYIPFIIIIIIINLIIIIIIIPFMQGIYTYSDTSANE